MAVTMNPPTVHEGSIIWSWSSDLENPEFWVYLNGELVAEETTATEFIAFLDSTQNAFLEVFDTVSHSATEIPSGFLELCWYEQDNISEWRVEELVSGTWTERAVLTDSDAWFYKYTTRFLEDGQIHRYRIKPVKNEDYEGDALEFAEMLVRHPDPPDVSFAYNGSGPKTVTITAN